MPGSPDQPPSRSTGRVPIDDLLSGGNPRTLRNVDQVVGTVLADPDRLQELTRCILASDDQVVRMRAGEGMPRSTPAHPAPRTAAVGRDGPALRAVACGADARPLPAYHRAAPPGRPADGPEPGRVQRLNRARHKPGHPGDPGQDRPCHRRGPLSPAATSGAQPLQVAGQPGPQARHRVRTRPGATNGSV